MRPFWILVHRYAGLFTAGFLFISGITGAIISWDHELDDILNPQLTKAPAVGRPQSPLALARQVEARYRQVRVSFVPLQLEPGESLALGVSPRFDEARGELARPGFNQVFVDPVSGAELGKRDWGAVWPITKETLVSFLYRLHYTLHIPAMWGSDRWGLWLMGGVAMVWLADSVVGLYLTLPVRRTQAMLPKHAGPATGRKTWLQRWRPAWQVRWRSGSSKLNFDLHRAFSLWTWTVLVILAFTAFSLNLYSEVFYPVMRKVSQVTPSPFDTRVMADEKHPIEPRISFDEVVKKAADEVHRRHWEVPVGSVYYAQEYGVYMVSLYKPGDDHGAAGVGPALLYYDGVDGGLLGDRQPWKGTAADIFVQAQFPLHSGRILGLPGRILISCMGLVVAMLSATGVLIWWRKRGARRATRRQMARQKAQAGKSSQAAAAVSKS